MFAKFKLNSIEVSVSEVLIESVISHDEFLLINVMPIKYNETEEGIKHFRT